jgi:hypothetical protein
MDDGRMGHNGNETELNGGWVVSPGYRTGLGR